MCKTFFIIGLACLLAMAGHSEAVPYDYLSPPAFTNYYGNVGGGDPGPPYGGYALGEWYPYYPIGFGGYGYDRSYAVRTHVPGGVYGYDGCGCTGYGKYGCNC